jgi:hypothetical protein
MRIRRSEPNRRSMCSWRRKTYSSPWAGFQYARSPSKTDAPYFTAPDWTWMRASS